MDAFFAAVEVLDDPDLAGRALIVGGDGRRGVVASCSYEARRYGVRSAMPATRARRQCPHAVFRPGRYERYLEVSRQIHAVFDRFTPLVEGIALDEAFLDVRGAARLLGHAPDLAVAVREAVRADVGLTCSVGVASTKFVAKLASEAAKPIADRSGVRPGRGVVVVEAGDELAFLYPLRVEALWGVGPATASRLRALGLTTVGELAAAPVEVIERAVGSAAGRHLHDLSRGVDPRPVQPDRAVRSVGHEETYAQDRRDRDGLHRETVRLSDAVSSRLRRAGLVGRTVQLKVRFSDFTTVTRAHTVSEPISTGPAVARVASGLLDAVDVGRGVRLLGVSVSSLTPAGRATAAEQLTLPLSSSERVARDDGAVGAGRAAAVGHESGPPPARCDTAAAGWDTTGARWDAATAAVDAIRARYGDGAVGPTTLLGAEGLRVGRTTDNRWGAVTDSVSDREPGPAPDGEPDGDVGVR
jgi:DNA polymerase-4